MPNKIDFTDPGRIIQNGYSPASHSYRQAESGLFWSPKGEISSAVRVTQNSTLLIHNSHATLMKYVICGAAAVGTPASAAAGVPVPPLTSVIINSGESSFVRGTDNTVFAFQGA